VAGLGLVTTSLSLPLPVGQRPDATTGDTNAAAPITPPDGNPATADHAGDLAGAAAPQEAAPRAGLADVPAGSQFNRGRPDGPVRLPEVGGDQPQASGVLRPERATPEALSIPRDTTRNPGLPDAAAVETRLPSTASLESETDPGLRLGLVSPVLPSVQIQPLVPPRQDGGPDIPARSAAPGTDVTGRQGAAPETTKEQTVPGFPLGDLDALDSAPTMTVAGPDELPAPPEDPDALPSLPGISVARSPQSAQILKPDVPSETVPRDDFAMSAAPRPDVAGGGGAGDYEEGGTLQVGAEANQGAPAEAQPAQTAAIDTFAVPFDATDQRPRMSIVLMDTGADAQGMMAASALRGFPYPVSFAIDVNRPDAAAAMRRYRDAGFEVLALAGLDDGVSDPEIAKRASGWFAQLSEAVAVMEATPGALQQDRAAAEALADTLSATGHGLLLYPQGGDTMRKLATREGVAAATLFRDFDSEGEAAAVIGRFLDYAALKADEDEGVIMVGRVWPQTISALLEWGLADRASQVQLVPVSAVLTQQRR
tara:strand:- start:4969 stop:6585 length:1617 start_codon:yes stop_codon:yes gene_type:complete